MSEPMIPDEESLFPRQTNASKDWRQKGKELKLPVKRPAPDEVSEPDAVSADAVSADAVSAEAVSSDLVFEDSVAPPPRALPAPKPASKPAPAPAAKKPSSGSGARVPATKPAPAPKRSAAVRNVLRAAAIFGAVGGIALLAQDRKPAPKAVVPLEVAAAKPAAPSTPVVALEKPAAEKTAEAAPSTEQTAAREKTARATKTPSVANNTPGTPVAEKRVAKAKKSLRELAKRSRHHEAIARILLELDPNNTSEDAALRVAYELSQLGAPAVPALREMLEEIDEDADRRVIALGLAGIKDDESAADGAGDALALVEDLPVQAKILRQLPETPSSSEAIATAFAVEPNAETRMLMLKEYTRRIAMNPEEQAPELPVQVSEFDVDAFLRVAAADKDIAIRRETFRLIEERGAPRDMDLAEETFKNATDPTTKKAALLAYAATAGEAAVPLLAELSQSPDVKARLEVVDAISRARSEKAIELMEKVCKDDPEARVKKHAQRMLAKMRDPS